MRKVSVLRTLVFALALAAPLSQAALAGQAEQQAMTNRSGIASLVANPYTASQPTVGD